MVTLLSTFLTVPAVIAVGVAGRGVKAARAAASTRSIDVRTRRLIRAKAALKLAVESPCPDVTAILAERGFKSELALNA